MVKDKRRAEPKSLTPGGRGTQSLEGSRAPRRNYAAVLFIQNHRHAVCLSSAPRVTPC